LLGFLRFVAMSLIALPPVLSLFYITTPVAHVDIEGGWPLLFVVLFVIGLGFRVLISDAALKVIGDLIPGARKGTHGDWHEGPVEAGLADYYLARYFYSGHSQAANEAMSALLIPSSVTSRVSESHVLKDERSEVSLTRTVRGSDSLTLLPVIRVPKGQLIGSLSVEVDGQASRTLPFDETKGLLLVMLYTAFEKVVGSGTQDPLLEELAALVVARHAPDNDSAEAWLEEVEQRNSASSALAEDRVALRKIVLATMSLDFVFAIVDGGCSVTRRVRVTHQRPYPDGIFGLGTRFQRAVGLGRRDFSFELGAAGESRSYHLNVEAPKAMYVEDSYTQLPFDIGTANSSTLKAGGRMRDEVLAVGRRAGDNFAHLYLRDFDGAPLTQVDGAVSDHARTKPLFRVELRERPPGILGTMVAVSFWIASLTWVVGIYHTKVFPSHAMTAHAIAAHATAVNATTGSGWPTLIFGVPAIVVGWLLSKVTNASLRTTTVGTFLLLTWLAIDAAMLVTIAALKSVGVSTDPWSWGDIHVVHTTWTLMMLLTALNFASCFGVYVIRNFRYAATINEGISR